ncbi:MgtC/SapB family protein [Hyphomonas sp. NPDC076900]|uniref:MgtC/SapB family protein n=1 Tax=unclassified Hyphomonas TaxID=2630699 RepID=UPI003D01F222
MPEYMMADELTELFATRTPAWSILLRLGCACVLGFLIGIDREIRGRPAGLRTHMLVSLAAATFTLTAIEITALFGKLEGVQIDPLRVVEAITSGVAFLAAGMIIQARGKVIGLTTGAGMWLAGAIGLACGAGMLTLALAATFLVLLILRPMRRVERMLDLADKNQSGHQDQKPSVPPGVEEGKESM